jgi:hypothetical protein
MNCHLGRAGTKGLLPTRDQRVCNRHGGAHMSTEIIHITPRKLARVGLEALPALIVAPPGRAHEVRRRRRQALYTQQRRARPGVFEADPASSHAVPAITSSRHTARRAGLPEREYCSPPASA